ncbi:MAG: hypothetical protein HY650_05410 [Acidobacteria bacterium]|nr:hypothetical protein [Acidobacteriota bacterium]
MRIRLLYFDGCPSYEHALRDLRDALAETRLAVNIELVQVTSPEEAERLGFLGSPTIQVDGVDLEGPDAVNKGVGFGCRVYQDGGQMRGWPSKTQIRAALSGRPKTVTSAPTEHTCCHARPSD